jgi:hypothetical protein
MRASNPVPMTEEQDADQAALDALRIRSAAGERIGQSAIAEAIRRAAAVDLDAQHTKRWEPTR